MKIINQQLRLLPNYFKKVGLVVVFLSLLVFVGISFGGLDLKKEPWYYLLIGDFVILGLLLFSMAEEKMEDEFITFLRIKAIIWAFFYVILAFIFTPIVNYIFGLKVIEMGSVQLVFSMLLGYILMFNYLKWMSK